MEQQCNINNPELNKPADPLVSIIVITYNSSNYVLETLESAKAQTYQNIELIVSDDCSTDSTVELCRNWIEDNKERFVRTELISAGKNTGTPANCNRGVKAAQGEWIKLIAGDDALTADCTERYMEFIFQNPFVEVLHSKATQFKRYLTEDNRLPEFNSAGTSISQPGITAKEQFEILLRYNQIFAGSIFIKRSVYDKVGYYDENLHLWDDGPMLYKITGNDIKLHFVNFVSYKYRVHEKSVQWKKSNDKLITDYTLECSKYYYKNYLSFLPPFERIIRVILIKRILILDKFNLNKNNKIIRAYLVFSSFPWTIILKLINKKYLSLEKNL